LEQAIEAVIPLASKPQAVVCAERAAAASSLAVAVAQFRPPPNSTHIWHSTFWADSVVHRRKATNPSTTSRINPLGGSFAVLNTEPPFNGGAGPKQPKLSPGMAGELGLCYLLFGWANCSVGRDKLSTAAERVLLNG